MVVGPPSRGVKAIMPDLNEIGLGLRLGLMTGLGLELVLGWLRLMIELSARLGLVLPQLAAAVYVRWGSDGYLIGVRLVTDLCPNHEVHFGVQVNPWMTAASGGSGLMLMLMLTLG